ncbi:MAG: DUF1493 family protein [Bacteroidota bacterium]|nr:DUF1493 family protein [Bacteroidota bacterium]
MVELELYNLISEITRYPKSNLNDNLRLEEDLGLYGDEAMYFTQQYATMFDVDMSQFPFDAYFSPEMDKISLFVRKLFYNTKNKTLTIADLKAGITNKKLM